jgi:phosphomannomutase
VQRHFSFFGKGALSGLRVGLYEHSSVARDLFHVVLDKLGSDVISFALNGFFVPIDTEAVRSEDVTQAESPRLLRMLHTLKRWSHQLR